MSYKVSTEVFQGPLDLLLALILKDDVDLYQISLVELVEEYLAEIERLSKVDLEVSTEFLLIAATLIELKCQRLLPTSRDIDLDEELSVWEERDVLLARLLEYKTFKDACGDIAERLQSGAKVVPRRVGLIEPFASISPDPLETADPDRLVRAMIRMLSAEVEPPEEVSMRHVTQIRWSVADATRRVQHLLKLSKTVTFSEVVDGNMERLEIVVHFLALLELYKQGSVDLTQKGRFDDIEIAKVDTQMQMDAQLVEAYDG